MIHKYNAKKTEFEGIQFPSEYEALVYSHLRRLEEAGEITKLERQITVVFFCQQLTKTRKNQITTIVDFVCVKDGVRVYIEASGCITPIRAIKTKLWQYFIREPLIIYKGSARGVPKIWKMICCD